MGPDRRMRPPAPACTDGQSHGKQPVIISVRTRSQYFPEAHMFAGPSPVTRPCPPRDGARSPCTSPVPPGRGGRPVGEHCRALGWSAMILAVGLGAGIVAVVIPALSTSGAGAPEMGSRLQLG